MSVLKKSLLFFLLPLMVLFLCAGGDPLKREKISSAEEDKIVYYTPSDRCDEDVSKDIKTSFSKNNHPIAYLVLEETQEIIPIDLESGIQYSSIPVPFTPRLLAVSTWGDKLYLVDNTAKQLYRLDLFSKALETIVCFECDVDHFSLSKSNQKAYFTYKDSDQIYLLNLKKSSIEPLLMTDKMISAMLLDPAEKSLYVSYKNSAEMEEFVLQTGVRKTFLSLQSIPEKIAVAGKKELIVFQENSPHITTFELKNGILKSSASDEKIGSKIEAIGSNLAGTILYYANAGAQEIFKCDLRSQEFKPAIQLSAPISSLLFLPGIEFETAFKADPQNAGNLTYFEAARLNGLPDHCLSYEWDFGDGLSASTTSSKISHSYQQAGVYKVRLTTHLQFESPLIPKHEIEALRAKIEIKSCFIKSLTVLDTEVLGVHQNETQLQPLGSIPSTTVSTPSQTNITYGNSVTDTAVVTGNILGGTPTGTVTFFVGATQLGSPVTLTAGPNFTATATSISYTPTALGSYQLTAQYSGDANYAISSDSSPSNSFTVSQAPTTTNLTTSLNPSVFGQLVTMTANVTSTLTPTGTVTFMDGSTVLGTVSLVSGTAMFPISTLSVGTHPITAIYNGDVDFAGSTSNLLTQTVNQGTTSTALSSSVNPTVFGNSTTLTATLTVLTGAGTPTGTVSFKDGTNVIGTGTVSGGVATFSTSNLAVGSHNLTAVYNGDVDFISSTSPIVVQTVNQGTTNSTVVSSVNPTTYGASTTFTATVAVATGAGTPTGNFSFFDGPTNLGTVNLTGASAAFTISTLSVNSHSITAVYSGDTNFQTSTSPVLTQVVNQAAPSITLVTSLTPSNYGQTVTFTSVVTAPTTLGIPSGSISFYDGATMVGTGTLTTTGANSSTATLTWNNLTGGSHSITAVYNGDTNFSTVTSSPPLIQTVILANTTTVLFSTSPNPTEFGEPVNLQANVIGSVTSPPLTPSGTVQFYDGATLIGTGTLSMLSSNAGFATFSDASLAIGSHSLSASYVGDVNYNPSNSSSISHQIIQTSTTTSTATSHTPSVFGETVTFTATVDSNLPGMGSPSGQVEFYNGINFIGTGTLSTTGPNSSQATISTSSLTLGNHLIDSIYLGDTNFSASNAPNITQVVVQDSTSTVIASTANPSLFGSSITLSATVTANAPGSGVPTGTVTFFEGATNLGTFNLDVNGVANYTTIAFYPGTHNITATYNGDTNFITSTAPSFAQVVMLPKLDTQTTITSSRNSSPVSQAVTYSARVTAITGIPTGSVSFYDNGVLIGTGTVNANGVATVTEPGTSLATLGLHPITAIYSGDANFLTSTSPQYDQYVVPYDTTTVLVSDVGPNIPVHSQQANNTLTATVTATGSPTPIPVFTGTVSFYEGTMLLGGPFPVPADGIVEFSPNNYHFGSIPVVAVYSGDQTQFATSTSNTLNLQVQQTDMLTTATTLSSSLSPSYFCEAIDLTAVVVATQGFYTPTGTVTFFDGSTALGTALLDNTGTAILSVSSLTVGTHTLSATYNSDSNYAFSTSNAITQTIIDNPTSLTLNLIPNLSNVPYGTSLAFVATATATYGIPMGVVTFSDELGELASVQLDSTGIAIYITNLIEAGSHTITATFDPSCCGVANACFMSATASVAVNILKANPASSLSISPSPSVYGNQVILSATVTSSAPISPTGTVSFSDGTTLLGTSPLIDGTATLAVDDFTAGIHIINASYSGDDNYISKNLPSKQLIVNKAPVAVSLVSFTQNPSLYGQLVTFEATVNSDISTPSGTITFFDGVTQLGQVALNGSGLAVLETSNLLLGANGITAVYSGDSNFLAGTSTAYTQTVVKAATLTTITSTVANPSVFNTSVTVNVSVAPVSPASGTPTGTVTGFYGSVNLGTATLASGIASFSTSVLPVGTPTITVVYNGDVNFTTSKGVASQTVNAATTTVSTLTSSTNPSVYGQLVTLSTKLASTAGTPTGFVTFLDGTTQLGVAALDSSGNAAISTAALSVATHPITVRYSGNGNFGAVTSSTLNQVVNKAATTTTLTSTTTTSFFGEPVSFTATVNPTSPGAGIPTGTVTFKNGTTTLGTLPLSNGGIVTFTTSSLQANATPYNITASFSGDGNFNTSTSTAVNQTVNPVSTVISAISSINPSALGQSVTFTVTVNPINSGNVIPTGVVTATYGSIVVGTGSLNASGQIVFTTSNLPVGTLPISFSYAGTSNFSPSSTSFTQTVTELSSSIGLASSLNPSHVGEAVTFTATVTSASGTPTGTVSFFDGSALIGTQVLNSSAVATLTLSNLTLGSHTINAVYNGDTNHSSAISSPLTQSVIQATTSTALSSSVNPSKVGQPTILTASISVIAGSGSPTGLVTFKDGSLVIGTSPVVGGSASLTVSSLSLGAHNLTAVYGGDANFATSTSTLIVQTVNQATTTTSISSSINPSTFGEATVLNATVSVSVGSGNPSGTVSFYNGAALLGTATLVNEQASLSVSNLSVGSHTLSAVYNGDANFAGSTSTNLTQVVQVTSSTTQLSSSLNPSLFGESIALTATVPTGSAPTAPTGTITFKDGSIVIGTQSLSSGTATLNISSLGVGTHSLTATYSGDSNFAASVSPLVTQIVNQGVTATTVSSSDNPLLYGNSVTFTANVTITGGAGTLTGNILFTDGATVLGTVPLTAGSATFSTSSLSVGTHPIVATYIGDANFSNSSSSTLSQIVNQGITSTFLSSDINPSTYGELITLTANVAITNGNGFPTGTVTFFDGTTVIGTGTLSAGTATLVIANLSVGTHSLTARYDGDDNFNDSTSSVLSQVVQKATSQTNILSTSPNPSMFGQNVTFFAAVSTPIGSPTGTVTFHDGLTTLGTVPVYDGLAIFATPILGIGNHSITATYNGDSSFLASTSTPPVIQVVNQTAITVTTVTTLTSSPNPSSYGEAVQFDVTVTPIAGGGTPTGLVTLFFGAEPLTTLTLDGSGSASYTTSSLPAGVLTIVALYSGDSQYSSSTATISQIVNPISTTTVITSSQNPSTFDEAVTFSATITSTTGPVPTGSVSFYNGSTLIGTSMLNNLGVGNITYSSLSTGSHTINAIYNADANFGVSSDSLVQVVNTSPTDALVLTSSPNPSKQGDPVTFVASVSSAFGIPTGSVTFYDGLIPLGTAPLFNGLAIFNNTFLNIGTHQISIAYSGDTNFSPSTSPNFEQIVESAVLNTTTTLSSSLNPAMLGESVTFTAQVTSSTGTPTGSVTFFDGSISIGTSLLVNGQAVWNTSSLSLGNHTITAVYSGDANYGSSASQPLTQVIIHSDVPGSAQTFYGCRVVNKFINTKEHVNVLTWAPPQNNADIIRYEIYRDAALTDLVGTAPNHCPYRFEDKAIKKHKTYTYYIVSVNSLEIKSSAVSTTVTPKK